MHRVRVGGIGTGPCPGRPRRATGGPKTAAGCQFRAGTPTRISRHPSNPSP